MNKIGYYFDLRKLNFKNRKVVHYTLLSSVVFLQLLLGLIIYNEVFNESKLEDLEAELHISEQARRFSDLTKEDYIAAQYNLQNFIRTKDEKYLVKYNDALTSLNENIQQLAKTAGESDLFTLHLNRSHASLSIENINTIIDSLHSIEILPSPELKENFQNLNRFNYKDVLDSIHVETSVSVDSLKQKKLFSRLSDAISGKVDIQKEKSEIVYTLRKGNQSSSGSLEEQIDYILKNTNDYYQKEFSNYKKKLASLKDKDVDFLNKNNELLNYSNLLLKKYNEALVSFTNDARNKFQEQYKINKSIRNYAVIGLIVFIIIISIVLVFLTRLAFNYEKRLVKAQIKIQENLNFKNRIVSMISHEIRSPLNIISIYSKGIRRQVKDEEVQESLKSIEFTTNSLALLANQILEFSKSENKKLVLNKTNFNLKAELEEILKTLSNFVETNQNTLHVHNDITQDINVYADRIKIHQLFYNIVGNSNKFTNKGNIFIKLFTEKITGNSIKLYVQIKDDGLGIDKEDLEHVFKDHRQGRNLGNVRDLGIGLGLNLCKEIIDLFKGEITITSKKNIETIVSFHIIFKIQDSSIN